MPTDTERHFGKLDLDQLDAMTFSAAEKKYAQRIYRVGYDPRLVCSHQRYGYCEGCSHRRSAMVVSVIREAIDTAIAREKASEE